MTGLLVRMPGLLVRMTGPLVRMMGQPVRMTELLGHMLGQVLGRMTVMGSSGRQQSTMPIGSSGKQSTKELSSWGRQSIRGLGRKKRLESTRRLERTSKIVSMTYTLLASMLELGRTIVWNRKSELWLRILVRARHILAGPLRRMMTE
jgi:hypothetical protein